MATRPRIKIRHTPVTTYSPAASQGNYVGAQATAGRRGTLPTFDDTNSYFIAKTGADSDAGTSASPKLTLGSLWSTSFSLNDNSGNGYNLGSTMTTATGSGRYIDKDHYPVPPQGNYALGPFTDTYYATGPAGLRTALGGLTAFTIECWVFLDSYSNQPIIWSFSDGASNNYIQISNAGAITFALSGVNLASANGVITLGKWNFIKAYFSSGATNGKRIYCGNSPETAVIVAQATQTRTTGAVTSFYIGRWDGGTTYALGGYIDRLYISNLADTTLPIAPGATGLLACYEFETRPLMQTAPKSYIVIKDSETYAEGLYANFPHEAIPAYGIYAADGQTPTFKPRRGVEQGTYGAGNPNYAPLSSSCHYRISKSGNDGTGTRDAGGTGTGSPFLTIQGALNHASRASGDVFRIEDSGEYSETLSLGSLAFTLQAKTGYMPILKPSPTSTATYHLQLAAAVDVNFSGIYFQGNSSVNLFSMGATPGPTGNALKFYDCSILNYPTAMVDTVAGVPIVNTTYQDCYLYSVGTIDFNTGTCFLQNCWVNSSLDISQPRIRWCTFTAKSASSPSTITLRHFTGSNQENKLMYVAECVFEPLARAVITTSTAAGVSAFGVVDTDFKTMGNYALSGEVFWPSGVGTLLVRGCYFDGGGTATASLYINTGTPVLYAMVTECAAVNLLSSATAFAFTGAGLTNCSVTGITAINVNKILTGGSGIAATRLAFKTTDATGYSGGVAPTYTNSNTSSDFISATLGAENIALVPTAVATFAGNASGSLDAGIDLAFFQFVTQGLVTIDGITFESAQNRLGCMSSPYPYAARAFSLKYCTFNEIGIFGVRVGDGCTVTKCLFAEPNGPAIRNQANLVTITYNGIYKGASAGIVNFGISATITNNAVYRCLYGLYEFDGSVPLGLRDNVLASSELYDYSGNNLMSYSCVGTLDPDRINTVDANSVRLDPLFRDPDNGDLRLQHLAVGSLFTSPAAGEGTGGADMGAFAFTYGTASTAWTTIDMGTSGYYNPDRLLRSSVAVRLSEDDQDNLAVRSASLGYRTQWQLTWEGGNPMSSAQTAALQAMFEASTNQVQIQFDGTNWVDGWLVKSNGFEYEEEPGYSDDSLPTPVKSVVIREA